MTVYLVGAGPGDPDLITRRGAALLERADAVVVDRLTAAELLDLVPVGAERHFVGKQPRGPAVPQETINEMLVELGHRLDVVVRLKGGDPFLFARGSEEIDALVAAGIDVEVVPGISSSLAVPASAGIPVTRRFDSTSVTIVTGHEAPGGHDDRDRVDWDAIARVGGTIVVLMGVAQIAEISRRLIDGGRSPSTPAAAIRWGTTPRQEVVVSTLAELPSCSLAAPAVIVIGDVVGSRHDWWAVAKPLAGLRIAVTRPDGQNGPLAARLSSLGAVVVVQPALRVEAMESSEIVLGALAELTSGDWLVFTSANGVSETFDVVSDVRMLAGIGIAAIGPATARELRRRGIVADLVPPSAVGESLADVFPAPSGATDSTPTVVLARAAVARPDLVGHLEQKGWRVRDVAVYRTVPVEPSDAELAAVGEVDAVIVTSPAGVEQADGWMRRCGNDSAAWITIGEITSTAVRSAGRSVAAEAEPHTDDGLVDAVLNWWSDV